MSTQAPKCSICGHIHPLGAPHTWDTEDKEKCVHKAKKTIAKCVHNKKEAEDVYTNLTNKKPIAMVLVKPDTMRQVSVRHLRANLARELKDMPFEVVRNGTVIARVVKP